MAAIKMSIFQHCLTPIICIGMSDGTYTDDEWQDLKSTTTQLATWFNISADQAWQECQDLFNYINNELSNTDQRFIYLRVPISCAIINKNLQSIEGRDYLVRSLEDQASADSVFTDDERMLITMYSKIIYEGGESLGIKV